jgi:predicted RNA-binding Zn-ribbon protein involved in translation (DUF1610 family)
MAFDYKIIVVKDPVFGKCPDCGAIGTLHRSRARNTKERLIKALTPFKIYRCKKCGWRGYRSTVTLTMGSLKALLFYLILGAITAWIVRFVITRFLGG